MKIHLALAASVLALAVSAPAFAAVTVGSYTLDTGAFGTGLGVHGTGGNQSGATVTGVVNQDGSGVTFSSTDTLNLNGSGEAIINGPFSNLTVTFAKAWNDITFDLDRQTGGGPPVSFDFSLLVNGTSLFNGISSPGNCSICSVGNGSGQFTISGLGITSLAFNFSPDAGDATQFRVEGPTGVPEPATWAIMMLGMGGLGAALRYRRRSSPKATFA